VPSVFAAARAELGKTPGVGLSGPAIRPAVCGLLARRDGG
jgi:hypothetical protein